jgi:cyclohexadieny/prephenate dehydrogenase
MDELVVIGMGHIGGSVAAAAMAQSLFTRVTGVEIDAAHADRARARRLADDVVNALERVSTAGLVVVAVPPSRTAEAVAQALDVCPRAVVTDTAGVKAPILARVRELSPHASRFVAAHPMAGTAASGPDSADPKLFEGRTTVICVDAQTDLKAVAAVEGLWRAIGATVIREEPAVHDRAIALVSHVPHALAFSLVGAAAAPGGDEQTYARTARLAGPSFESATRVAASDPALWADLFLSNKDALLDSLGALRNSLANIEAEIMTGNATKLRERLARLRKLKTGAAS